MSPTGRIFTRAERIWIRNLRPSPCPSFDHNPESKELRSLTIKDVNTTTENKPQSTTLDEALQTVIGASRDTTSL